MFFLGNPEKYVPPISDHHDPSHDVPSRSKTRPRAGPTHQIRTRPGAQDLHQQHEMDQANVQIV